MPLRLMRSPHVSGLWAGAPDDVRLVLLARAHDEAVAEDISRSRAYRPIADRRSPAQREIDRRA